jgi:hypothetical protein
MNLLLVLDNIKMATYGRLRGALVAPSLQERLGGNRLAKEASRRMRTLKFEQAIEAVRRERVETERAEEVVKEYGFRRTVLVAVLCILGSVALGSLTVVVTGVVTGMYPLAAGAVLTLSGSGGLTVLAWRTYMGSEAHGAI